MAILAKGMYVIFSPSEFAAQKCSSNDVIDQLMLYKHANYYVGMLSAASYYGATHYRPMKFQVVTNKELFKSKKPELLEKVEFHVKHCMPSKCIRKVKGRHGYINYSTPALTMYDLLRCERNVGGIENITLVIKELLPVLEIEDLKKLLVENIEGAHLQRLGYLLERLGAFEYASVIKKHATLSSVYLKLSRVTDPVGAKNKIWRIIDNADWDEINDTFWNN